MISLRKIGRHLGAEILGVDLSQPLDDAKFAGSRMLFRNLGSCSRPELTRQQVSLAAFGELEHHVRKNIALRAPKSCCFHSATTRCRDRSRGA